jgi:transposase-like protein
MIWAVTCPGIFEPGKIWDNGARRVKGLRGRGARGKTIVFGLFKRNGRVYTEVVPDCSKPTLQGIIRGRVELKSVIHSDGWRGYDGLVDLGYQKHFRVEHSPNEFANKQSAIMHVNDLSENDISGISEELENIREEIRDNVYLIEAKEVFLTKNFRSTIINYWNVVIDDLRNKAMHRSLELFNKELKKSINSYEDFQDNVTDFELIEGCYKIGVIGWEAKKILHQARETRNIYAAHPKSKSLTLAKILNFIVDCNTYVLSQEYPHAIINIEEYMRTI